MFAWLKELKRFKALLALILMVTALYGLYFYYYFHPITNNAFVVANIRPIAAQVSGYIEKIFVKNGDSVTTGQPLFELDKTLYQLKVKALRHELLGAKIILNAQKKEIANLKLQLTVELNKKATAKERYLDAASLIKTGAASKFSYHQLKHAFHQQQAIVFITKNRIEKAEMAYKHQMQTIKKTQSELKQAEYELAHTTVYAKSQGIISNMFLSVGYPVTALKPLFSFVDTKHFWVQANFKETDLTNTKAGQKAKITLRMYGDKKVFNGRVVSINWAVDRQLTDKNTYLPIVESENQWTLMPQRFPVLIEVLNSDKNYPLHVGASAYVTLEE